MSDDEETLESYINKKFEEKSQELWDQLADKERWCPLCGNYDPPHTYEKCQAKLDAMDIRGIQP